MRMNLGVSFYVSVNSVLNVRRCLNLFVLNVNFFGVIFFFLFIGGRKS